MKQLITLIQLSCAILFFTPIHAQSWQWGERGGSADGTVGGGADEYPRDIATDVNGNIYVLTYNLGKTSLNIGGTSLTIFGEFDVVLASFDCGGKLRWAKAIGCSREDYGWALQTDKKDGVYFAFKAAMYSGSGTNTLNFDNDKTLNIPNTQGNKCYKSVFIAKYDTSGNFKWVTAPQPDTVGVTSNTGILALDIDDQGVLYCLSTLSPGLYESSYSITKQGTYFLKYSSTGSFLGGLSIDADITLSSTRYTYFKRSDLLNRFVISGAVDFQGPVFIGGKEIKGSMYVATFDNAGKLLWSRTDTGANGGITNRAAIDGSGNIYIAAKTVKDARFNGYTTKANTNHGTVMLMKMDKNGNMVWAQNAVTNASTESAGIALRNSGEVVMTGAYPGLLKFNTHGYIDSLNLPANSGYYPFIARFNTHTGKILGIHNLPVTGHTITHDIITDGRNSLYISGEFASRLTINGNTLASAGGNKDFFVAKYGYADCNCTDIPEPTFTQTVNNHFTYDFNYTGTAATTYEWDFGDGNTSTQQSPSHTYATVGDFITCVKVTNSCGDNIYCSKISTQWPQTVSGISESSSIKIYPNPAHNVLYVDGVAPGSRIELYDVVGRKVHEIISAKENEIVNTSYLPSGNYLIRLTDKQGKRVQGKIAKQ